MLLVPISLSGAAAGLARPSRRADQSKPLCGDGRKSLPPSAADGSARLPALERGFQPIVVRMPESDGWPATVTAREGRRGEGAAGGRVSSRSISIRRPGACWTRPNFATR